jgi:hypothetical protein
VLVFCHIFAASQNGNTGALVRITSTADLNAINENKFNRAPYIAIIELTIMADKLVLLIL